MADHIPVTDDELHVYVDGELPADRREAVETWLASQPEDAARVAAWRAQAEMVRARYGAVAEEAVPARLALDRLTRNRRSWITAAAAATVVAFVAGGVAGWMARGADAASPAPKVSLAAFADDALSAHRLYIDEVRHPVEVGANEDHLLPWLSRRVGMPVRAPDLSAFRLTLIGGRLLPGVVGPAALFMYESGSGERITLYLSRATKPRSSFRYKVEDEFGALRWADSGYCWVLSGPNDKSRLKSIAVAIYEQLDNRPPPPRTSADQLISRRGS